MGCFKSNIDYVCLDLLYYLQSLMIQNLPAWRQLHIITFPFPHFDDGIIWQDSCLFLTLLITLTLLLLLLTVNNNSSRNISLLFNCLINIYNITQNLKISELSWYLQPFSDRYSVKSSYLFTNLLKSKRHAWSESNYRN